MIIRYLSLEIEPENIQSQEYSKDLKYIIKLRTALPVYKINRFEKKVNRKQFCQWLSNVEIPTQTARDKVNKYIFNVMPRYT